MGAPTVMLEKLDSDQAEGAVAAVVAAYRSTKSQGTELAALISGEIGGGNGLAALTCGAHMGLPVVDGDFMGRAFPELQMTTQAIYGLDTTPAALVDEKGNAVVVSMVQSNTWLERLLRPVCTEMGCSSGFATAPLTGQQLRKVVVPHSLSLAFRLGQAVAAAQHAKRDAVQAAADVGGGAVIFSGKVADAWRTTTEGFAKGHFDVAGLEAFQGQVLRVQFQNENLVAHVDGLLTACVPDLICCIESANGLPVATEEMRYGLLVSVLALPAHPLLRTPEALDCVGPAAFGFGDLNYRPVSAYKPPVPVVT